VTWETVSVVRSSVLTTDENPASRDGAGSSQSRNTDGPSEINRAANSSAGHRSWSTMRGAMVELVFDGKQMACRVPGEADALGEVVASATTEARLWLVSTRRR
jgi:hypothetical protein